MALSNQKQKQIRDAALRQLEKLPEYLHPYWKEILAARAKGEVAECEVIWKRFPVTPEMFFTDEYYLPSCASLYPVVLESLIELNTPENGYTEAVLTGGIGSAKTTIALHTAAYQVYLLSCMRNPHKAFGLDPTSEILIIFQSLSAHLASSVDYKRFRTMLQDSPYFKEKYNFNRKIESKMVFENRVEVTPVSGMETAAIGQNVIGGMIDEVNYMEIIEKSSKARGVDGSTYDQAQALYNSISRRRETRFMSGGITPGILCLCSSKRYPEEFTEQRTKVAEREIAETGETSIYVYDKAVWEVKPEGTYSGDVFYVYAGGATDQPRIIPDEEEFDGEVVAVPVEYRKKFETDMLNSLRELAGVSLYATHPFILNTQAINDAFGRHESIVSRDACDFVDTHILIYPHKFRNPELPRWCHIDLGVTGDAAGLAIGHVQKFTNIDRGMGQHEILPIIDYDMLLRVTVPTGGEINFEKIRKILYTLRAKGLNIMWVTFDSYQSIDSLQQLWRSGFVVGQSSLDRDTLGYDILKSALYDGRVVAPECDHAEYELRSLEHDVKARKIDHPPHASKDLADSMAGVAKGLTLKREVWARYDVSMRSIPESIKQLTVKAPAMKEHD